MAITLDLLGDPGFSFPDRLGQLGPQLWRPRNVALRATNGCAELRPHREQSLQVAVMPFRAHLPPGHDALRVIEVQLHQALLQPTKRAGSTSRAGAVKM
jgi:hypothetical protein